MHKVKCYYCQEYFDANKEKYVMIGTRRYAHLDCSNKYQIELTQDEKDYELLETYIKEIFGTDYVTARIKKQIRDFRQEYKYSYTGMLKTLVYWFKVKGNTLEKTNGGIGIIPFVYDEAYQYFYNVFLMQQLAKELDHLDYKVKEVEIPPPIAYYEPPKLFNFEEEIDE